MNIEYRSPTPAEWTSFGPAVARGFGNHPPTDASAQERWDLFGKVMRAVGAWDGDQIVGTSGSFVGDTTVPGGAQLPAALVTIVTVAATHRRRGILTNMMSRLLKEAHERGEPIATLWASESIIYGRFGYGIAGHHYDANIRSEKASLAHLPEIPGSVKYADRKRVREVAPGIWSRTAANHPGMPARSETGWQAHMPLPEDKSKPDERKFYAVYEENGRADGYVSYKMKDKGIWTGQSDLRIEDLVAATDAAYAALWQFILGIDLIDDIAYETMPLDDPLWWMLSDPRHLRRTTYDAIWLRILDVERTLSARSYAEPLDVVISVKDEFCPWADGSYRLTVDTSGKAECRRTDDSPDVEMPAASLATCYFGSTKFADLARAGRVEENTPGTLSSLDHGFVAEREPWCPMHY